MKKLNAKSVNNQRGLFFVGTSKAFRVYLKTLIDYYGTDFKISDLPSFRAKPFPHQ